MHHKPLDKAGIIVAVLCALHCLLVPVVLPTLALMGLSFLGFELFERIILSISLIIGGIAIVLGIRHHQSLVPLVLLILGGVTYFNKHFFGHGWEPLVILAGASLLIIAHTLNLHLCRAKNRKPCEQVEDASIAAAEHPTT
ncbi:MerC domain-containing protein [Aliidiomarina haloalkalitolerans]|uniref:MerC domain-containing protein n=1 Tax=Aliidiomarina haloalkalitolerans TaxID=859059 RepID=A0A432VUX4_9GAMM|nr:MerC domain-containing protein [Aliidiomarina haloalkalitolerans]RUO20330.1 MerC domain-containing protein [Aliidiomarina haloalkalitolerans]